MRGFGDKITTISNILISNYIVLVNPNCIVSTRKVFEEFEKNASEGNTELPKENHDFKQLLTGCNDLQETAIKIYPEIGLLLNTMKKLYPRDRKVGLSSIQMSGSGASCFALFEDKKTADMFCRKIQLAGYWSVSTKFMVNF